ncbi:hypothetical protein B0H17DRAFT_1163757 [Mycena rosella]|uniref:CxC1-like cysteine cluster associated with KDZ transposases domain-containing protein n=1 Tax=Mycena rosella TaxID=1033263 RepID=A0AAD7CHE3_MYCRO|nr:hypothetical protein B0H17DRAFT_1163757 [Mycena rosella]
MTTLAGRRYPPSHFVFRRPAVFNQVLAVLRHTATPDTFGLHGGRALHHYQPEDRDSVEDIELAICQCMPAAVQLMKYGAFPCASFHPSLAVDLHVLEFTINLFLQIAPNNTVFSATLERCLASMGFQLDHQHSLRRRFGNCLMWYIHLRNQTKQHYNIQLEKARELYLEGARPAAAPSNLGDSDASDSSDEGERSPPRASVTPPPSPITPRNTSDSPRTPPPPRGRHRKRGAQTCAVLSPSGTPAPASPGCSPLPTRKRARSRSWEAPLPFPEPPPRTPCFGRLKHDPDMNADINVCIDACFTQKRRKSPRDPPHTHPQTHFVPEDTAARTEAYVDNVSQVEEKRAKRQKAMEDALDAEDGYEHPQLLLPRSVLDGCEASFKAADEKREKASTEFFEDTAIMGLLCHHDRVLWLVNMHSVGEKKFYVIALMETLFQHLPRNITIGLLYDVACSFERTCRKWGFLARFMDRLAFAVSVFHAFGHEWACQLLYHPCKCKGFGFTNGEGCERFWHSISHLIANLRISGYHNWLYTLDLQIEHADEASLANLGEWIQRHRLHSIKKRAEATQALQDCGKPLSLLRRQWALQVKTQTKPLPRRSKNKGQQAVNAVMLLRTALKVWKAQVIQIRHKFLDAVEEEDPDAIVYEVELAAAEEAQATAERHLCNKEDALGVSQRQALHTLATSQYLCLRMNARALKRRLRDRLWSRKFELDRVERSFRRLVNDQKLYSHTESAVKRREPTISKVNADYNKLCGEIAKLIQDGQAPRGAIAPNPIPAKGIWQLDVNGGIWEDIGLDDDDAEAATEPPLGCATSRSLPDLGIEEGTLPPWGPALAEISACVVDAHVAARGEDRHYSGSRSDDEEGEDSGSEEEEFGMLEAIETADVYRNAQERDRLY